MKDKYYIPTIEEFYRGFEYEFNSTTLYGSLTVGDVAGWQKTQFYGGSGPEDENSEMEDINQAINGFEDIRVRVKYLDEDDLKSLGWVKYKDVTVVGTELSSFRFILNEMCLWFTPYNIYNNRTMTVCISEKDKEKSGEGFIVTGPRIFYGTIKNKSELQRLMKQLGI